MSNSLSIIIEWENAKLSDLGRAERMLSQLNKQMAEVARRRGLKAELLLLYDSDEVGRSVPEAAVASQINASTWPGAIRLIPAPGQRYYEQKNTGANLASGDILVFLDSDVVPDDGWLEGLLDALDDPQVNIVGGETYHATDALHDKLFAAFWTFPTRRPSRGLYEYKNFYANNLAVRKALFAANAFPTAAAYRGQCSKLAESLRAKGIAIYRQGESTVSHPPPEGARSFVTRAVCQGYDAVYWKNTRRFGWLLNTNPVAALVRLIRQMLTVIYKVVRRAREVGLSPLGALAAIGMGFAYYFCKFAGEVVSFFAPSAIRRNLSV